MKRLSVFLLAIVVTAPLASLEGCRTSEGPAAVDDELYTREQVMDLDDAYGGFNFSDEAPGFDDPGLLGEFSEDGEAEFDDPITRDPRVAEFDRRQRDRLYLMITWGNLCRSREIDFVTDWSGSLTVDPGAIVLKRVIRFEPSDEILPRVRRDLLEWKSQTRGAFDGILVRVYGSPSLAAIDTTTDSTATMITFSTERLEVSFSLKDLPNLHRVIEVDNAGNAVAFNAVHVPPQGCPRGFMRGVWRDHPEREGGVFFGRWIAANGHFEGFLRGHYGVNGKGEHVFFGKLINPRGRFMGILAGEYGYGSEKYGGWFSGRWVTGNLRTHGRLKGEWKRHEQDRNGFFRGRWEANCR
jgi:hypothetical protein